MTSVEKLAAFVARLTDDDLSEDVRLQVESFVICRHTSLSGVTGKSRTRLPVA